MERFQEKYPSEKEARANAVLNHGQEEVVIVASQDSFYLEDAASAPFLRTWEREIYNGLGRKAMAK